MQYLDVISINIWNILASLANLVILFLLVKKFLFKPVLRMIDARQAMIDGKISGAEQALAVAEESKAAWEEKLSSANEEADGIIKEATDRAKMRAEAIISEADEKALALTRRTEEQLRLEREKAESEIKQEIVDVSVALAEKMLKRKLSEADHRGMINEFINEIGEGDGRGN